MKIAILTFWFLPNVIGGSELTAYRYAQAMVEKGHEVHIITQLDDKNSCRYQIMSGFHVHRIRRFRIRIIGTVFYFFSLYRLIRKLKPDVIHEQGIQGLSPFIKKISNIPYVVFPRGSDFYLNPGIYQKVVVRFTLKYADALMAQTLCAAKEMQKLSSKEVTIIPNSVDFKRFASLPKENTKEKFGIRRQWKTILCVANLRPVKGLHYLIEAMNYVVRDFPEVQLYLVGRDDQKGKLQRLVYKRNLQEKIIFTDLVPPDEIPKYMAAADIFVLPSLSEGFPNVLLEAEAAGLPIVATSVGDIPEIVKEGENGFLVPPKNPYMLAEKLLFLLRNESVRKRVSSNNIEKARDYNWSDIVTSLEKVYLTIGKN